MSKKMQFDRNKVWVLVSKHTEMVKNQLKSNTYKTFFKIVDEW